MSAMTWKQAFIRCSVAGRVSHEVAAELAHRDWWDDECDDVDAACRGIRDQFGTVDRMTLIKALVALDYTFDDAVALGVDATWEMPGAWIDHYAAQLAIEAA